MIIVMFLSLVHSRCRFSCDCTILR